MKWSYQLTTNTIWLSFDYGEVEAETIEEATEKAIKKLKVDLDLANKQLEPIGATISLDFKQLEVSKLV